jgi:hypothetical protein
MGPRSFRYHAWRGNPSEEEVKDGPHGDNRCGSNRSGIAPTTAPLRPQSEPGLSDYGFYNALGCAGAPTLVRLSHCALEALCGTLGGPTMTTPGGAGTTLRTAHLQLPRVGTPASNHGVGAPTLRGSDL